VFVVPVGLMIRYSFYQQTSTGDLTASATLANYCASPRRSLPHGGADDAARQPHGPHSSDAARLSAALVMGAHALNWRALTVIVIAPMLINVVVRTYACA